MLLRSTPPQYILYLADRKMDLRGLTKLCRGDQGSGHVHRGFFKIIKDTNVQKPQEEAATTANLEKEAKADGAIAKKSKEDEKRSDSD